MTNKTEEGVYNYKRDSVGADRLSLVGNELHILWYLTIELDELLYNSCVTFWRKA